jgi:hypothetical protein
MTTSVIIENNDSNFFNDSLLISAEVSDSMFDALADNISNIINLSKIVTKSNMISVQKYYGRNIHDAHQDL